MELCRPGSGGARLWSLTRSVSRQLLPVFDEPMVYCPLSTLVRAGVCEILVVTAPDQQDQFRRLLDDGSRLGLRITYAVQERPTATVARDRENRARWEPLKAGAAPR
ncbi:sugar phosphate nucleotidyltransferase [Streptomyces sp. HNM0645]|uniref:sugar phosphate nucleotidyltransferase n=1 Tax=Streptomyces sp. HNM0645 TaxID=2782343 RepID=UPI0024B6E953|nr:sugar phosphate nucleotidyltransferase [Streptomyces sp. HNM0645]MDI9888958.1 sugar phosphate nucleotidyltransferase [Streptomyces sp. HNM0645]